MPQQHLDHHVCHVAHVSTPGLGPRRRPGLLCEVRKPIREEWGLVLRQNRSKVQPIGLVEGTKPLVASLLLVAMPGAPSSVLATSSDARSP